MSVSTDPVHFEPTWKTSSERVTYQAPRNLSDETSWIVNHYHELQSSDVENPMEPLPDYEVDQSALHRVTMESSPHYDVAFTEVQQAFSSSDTSSNDGHSPSLPEPDYDLPLADEPQQQQPVSFQHQANERLRPSLDSDAVSSDQVVPLENSDEPPPDYD
jgi:hypothetical protein